MNNQIVNMLMSQLKTRNPQMANQIQELINSNGNPMSLYQQMIKGKSPEQMAQFYQFAKQWGIPDEVINQAQNGGINTQ